MFDTVTNLFIHAMKSLSHLTSGRLPQGAFFGALRLGQMTLYLHPTDLGGIFIVQGLHGPSLCLVKISVTHVGLLSTWDEPPVDSPQMFVESVSDR